jgi:membrane-associated phospholipid phosphatase
LWQDNNGVSGHAFISSLPFITAAKMCDDNWAKAVCYAGSSLGPLSRINDNAHYPSQVVLGWWLAFLAASAVDHADARMGPVEWWPYVNGDQLGIMAEHSW